MNGLFERHSRICDLLRVARGDRERAGGSFAACPRALFDGDAQTIDAGHGRALAPEGIDGVYAATAPDGRVIALLLDDGSRTKSVVVIRPATL